MDRLDPGISKRPSRFDRKYLFDAPNKAERIQYCEFWRSKVSHNPKIEFPQCLCLSIAEITENFTFAYMKEAFIAALLQLAVKQNATDVRKPRGNGNRNFDGIPLWIEIKKQVENLKMEIGAGSDKASGSPIKPTQMKQRSCFSGFFR